MDRNTNSGKDHVQFFIFIEEPDTISLKPVDMYMSRNDRSTYWYISCPLLVLTLSIKWEMGKRIFFFPFSEPMLLGFLLQTLSLD